MISNHIYGNFQSEHFPIVFFIHRAMGQLLEVDTQIPLVEGIYAIETGGTCSY